jgi:hypothetical protein
MANLQSNRDTEMPETDLTWRKIAAIEPRLSDLYDSVRRIKDPGGACFCAESLWHRRLKWQLQSLVGFRAHEPRLRSMAAYDIAFEKIYHALPPCRGCACMAI